MEFPIQVVIADQDTFLSAWQEVTEQLSEEAEQFYRRARLASFEIDPTGSLCRLEWWVERMPQPEWEEELCHYFCNRWPFLDQVSMKYNLDQSKETWGEIVVERWHEWTAMLGDHIPVCRPILEEFLPEPSGSAEKPVLTVFAGSESSLQLLQKRGCDLAISRLLWEQLGLSVVVRFERKDQRSTKEFVNAHDEKLRSIVQKALSMKEKRETAGDGILLGRAISESPVPLREISDRDEDVLSVQGEIIAIESRTLRTGRVLFQMDITDYTDSLTMKCYVPGEHATRMQSLVPGTHIRAKGIYQYDKYAREHVLQCNDLMVVQTARRRDTAPEKRVELHLHTKMSAMDALLDIDQAVKLLAEWGHEAVAVTDHGVVQAFPEAYAAGKRNGVKIILGIEGYLYDADLEKPRTHHVIILVKNETGLRNLYKLVTLAHLEHFYRVPRISKQLLDEHREGLIIGSACEAGELMRAITSGAPDEKLLEIASFYDYLEIQPLANNAFMLDNGMVESEEDLRNFNRKVVELGRILNKPVVATGDVHFLNPEDEVYRRILLAGKGMKDTERETPLYLRTTDEMLAEFSYLGEDVAYDVVVRIPRQIAAQVEDVKPSPDGLFAPQIDGADEEIRAMAYQRAVELYGEPLPTIVEERLEYELRSIIDNGYAGLYWIAHKLVKRSLDDGYLVGSRGSVGSSLVATLTDITEVNPLPPHWHCLHCHWHEFIEDGSVGSGFDLPDRQCPNCGETLQKDGHDIPFAVFMGFHGDKVPDIDLNFSGEYQPQAHRYTEELLGKENVFRAGTISSIAERTAYGFVKGFATDRNMELRNAEINRLVRGLTGVKRTTGQHPGGLIVIPKGEDVYRFTPLQHPADDRSADTITTHFDYHSIDENLVKLDILGHDDPTVLRMLEDLTGIDVRRLPFDDPATLKLFSSLESLDISPEDAGGEVGTLGIPEFGTRFVRGMLQETKPQTFSELVRISGLSHGTDVWLNNAQELIRSNHTDLKGVISARDDIMVYLIYQGMDRSHAFQIMEKVRKGKGLSPEDEEAMHSVGVPQWYIESCKKIKYLFPKAHAVAYVMMAFRIAWFKVHHPLAFYAAYFTVRSGDFDAGIVSGGLPGLRKRLRELQSLGNEATAKDRTLMTIAEVAIEMMARGYSFLPVDLFRSDDTKFIIEENGLRLPFVTIAGLGKVAAQRIVAAREESPFRSRDDLRKRAKLSKAVIDMLEQYRTLDHLPESDQLTLFS